GRSSCAAPRGSRSSRRDCRSSPENWTTWLRPEAGTHSLRSAEPASYAVDRARPDGWLSTSPTEPRQKRHRRSMPRPARSMQCASWEHLLIESRLGAASPLHDDYLGGVLTRACRENEKTLSHDFAAISATSPWSSGGLPCAGIARPSRSRRDRP